MDWTPKCYQILCYKAQVETGHWRSITYPQVMENVPSSNGYQGGFMSKLMQKDLNLAMQTAQDTNVETPMGAKAAELYEAHTVENGDKDFSSIMGRHDHSVLF